MISKLVEYLKNLKARKTLKALNNLNTFNNFQPLFKMVKEGKMDNKSMTAIGVIGYKKKETADLCNFKSAVIKRNK
jgi:hypothetical protein